MRPVMKLCNFVHQTIIAIVFETKGMNVYLGESGHVIFVRNLLLTAIIRERMILDKKQYGKCNCTFKNIGDLNRHACTHSAKWIVCPDCPNYKTKDKRNFESHRQRHNQIEKYWCSTCGKGFVHSTQKSRHEAQKNCKKA